MDALTRGLRVCLKCNPKQSSKVAGKMPRRIFQ